MAKGLDKNLHIKEKEDRLGYSNYMGLNISSHSLRSLIRFKIRF